MPGTIQFPFRQRFYTLKCKAGFTLLCVMMIALCCGLGDWQLHRYHFKKTLVVAYQQNKQSAPVAIAKLRGDLAALQFKQVIIHGHYLNEQTVIVENRPYQNQMGFEVLTPFRLEGEKTVVLIDRGWKPYAADQQITPIAPVTDKQQIIGSVKLLNEYQFILGKNIYAPRATPLVVQKIDLQEISQITHQAFYPFVLRLDPKDTTGFVRDWTAVASVQPERHMGYAVQWFLLALALIIAWFCYSCERVEKDGEVVSVKTEMKSNRVQLKLIALLLIFVIPMMSGILLYRYYDHFNFKTTNLGTLVHPAVHISDLALNAKAVQSWQIIYAPAQCNANAEKTKFSLHQLHTALGKNQERVSLAWVTNAACKQPAHDFRKIIFTKKEFAQLNKTLSTKQSDVNAQDKIYLVDPIGNLFMYYPADTNAMNILKDLKKVLEVSQIG